MQYTILHPNGLDWLNNNFSLTKNEWIKIKLFCDFLKPFYEFTVKIPGSEYLTLEILLLFLDYLQDHLNILTI